nr:intraflagellar transport protein 74 homolog isoform X3 [Physcomitrium patens]|eukprot:XP_024377500.1 intraflagellar transport protein 74 homolog isoform X3 [Physcomitrella patens]
MEFSRKSTMGSTPGTSRGDSPPRSTHDHHARQMSSLSYGGRPPSAQGSVRPSTSRSIRSIRLGGSLGLNSDITVESRPLTQQGLMTLKSNGQGPGRQVQDKSYYLSKLRTRKQELQAEIDIMNDEIDRLQKREPANVYLEQKQNSLNEEVISLKSLLADYNVVKEKVAAGVELDELKEELRSAKEKNEAVVKKVARLFNDRTRKEQSYKAAEEKIQFLEAEIRRRIDDEAPEIKARYVELQEDACRVAAEVERLELETQDITGSSHALEQDLRPAPPAKQKAVMLIEQLLNAEVELNRLKAEEVPNVQLSPEEARGAMLLKMRQNNAEIAKAEEKIKQVEDEVKNYEEKIAEADNSLSELKGGRAEKFLEMQRKERKMQAFIDSFDTMKHEHEEAARLVHQRIVQLLRQTNQWLKSANKNWIS